MTLRRLLPFLCVVSAPLSAQVNAPVSDKDLDLSLAAVPAGLHLNLWHP